MVGIEPAPAEHDHCPGCGRALEACQGADACGRGGPGDPPRFCRRCGWRLREIAVVPGRGGLWCRAHGVLAEEG